MEVELWRVDKFRMDVGVELTRFADGLNVGSKGKKLKSKRAEV